MSEYIYLMQKVVEAAEAWTNSGVTSPLSLAKLDANLREALDNLNSYEGEEVEKEYDEIDYLIAGTLLRKYLIEQNAPKKIFDYLVAIEEEHQRLANKFEMQGNALTEYYAQSKYYKALAEGNAQKASKWKMKCLTILGQEMGEY